jgi:hypothetical protein
MKPDSQLLYLWDDIALRPFLGEVRRRHGVIETLALPSMRDLPPVQIETLFVAPLLAETLVSPDSDPTSWPRGASLLEELRQQKQLVVLGDPGGGKTTLCNWVAWKLASGLTSGLPDFLDGCIPLPCVLRDMPSSIFSLDVTLEDLAEAIANKLLGENATARLIASIRLRVKKGNYLLILDGIDEIPTLHRDVVTKWVQTANQHQAFLLATSRIVGYEDGGVDREIIEGETTVVRTEKTLSDNKTDKRVPNLLSEILNETRLITGSSDHFKKSVSKSKRWATIRYLMPFDQSKISAFAENWYRQRCGTEHEAQQKTADLLTSLSQSEVTQQLARTPNLLSLMAIVHRERAHLPDGKALLYDEIANAYINTIDMQRKIAPGDALAPYGWKERKAWLAYVGFRMQQRRGRNSRTGRTHEKDDGVLASQVEVEQWLTEAMSISGVQRPVEASKVFLSWVARRSGLLLPRGEGRYAFVHLSFQEYFCACFLDSCIVRPAFIRDQLNDEALVTKEYLSAWSRISAWSETFVYLFELLSAERDSEWVEDLAHFIFSDIIDNNLTSYQKTSLAARILKNRHIRLGEKWLGRLADLCAPYAYEEWIEAQYGSSAEALTSLIDAGFAIIINGTKQTDSDIIPSLLERSIDSIDKITHPEKVRIAILNNVDSTHTDILNKTPNIRFLNIKNCELPDISIILRTPKIETLSLNNTLTEDLSPLASLKLLKTLHLCSIKPKKISSLSKLTKVTDLRIEEMIFDDITPLAAMKELQAIEIESCKIKDMSPLSSLTKLAKLSIQTSPSINLSTIQALTSIDHLNIYSTNAPDLSFIANLTKLKSLFLFGTNTHDISGIATAKNIITFYINSPNLKDISALSELTAMGSLYIDHAQVSNLKPLAEMKSLHSLSLSRTKIRDISPLRKLSNLITLNISGTAVTDIKPLMDLPRLRHLNATDTKIKNLSLLNSKNIQVELHNEYS